MNSKDGTAKVLQKAYISDKGIFFEQKDGFENAIKDGFFLLKIPEYIKLSPAIRLAESFYKESNKNNSYTGFKDKENIYFDRENFQTEHILLDQNHRRKFFPKELNKLCDMMDSVGAVILEYVFRYLKLSKNIF